MITYVAFLRGINVGGHKIIRMEELARTFASAGLKKVKTYIQSGNVIFDSAEADVSVLEKKIERKLLKSFGHEVPVVVLPLTDLAAIVRRNPFSQIKTGADAVLFVAFLDSEKKVRPKLPLKSSAENLEVFAVKDRAAFIVARRKKTGRFGFPNSFVEKEFGVSATTRNWNSLKKIVAAALSEAQSQP